MAEFNLRLLDIQPNERSGFIGPRTYIRIDHQPVNIRRWRPDMMVGVGAKPFRHHYYGRCADLPWAGYVISDDAMVIENGQTVVGDQIVVGRGLMEPLEIFPAWRLSRFRKSGDYWSAPMPEHVVKFSGVTANFAVFGWHIYGHWLVDVLPRLMRTIHSGHAIDRYLFAGPAKGWMWELLETLDVDRDKCHFVDLSSTAVECERVIQATYSRFNSEVRLDICDAAKAMTGRVQADRTATRKLYIQREGRPRALYNRNEVDALLIAKGFEVVHPEKMSIADQIKLFAETSHIIGQAGSGLHNSLFARAGLKIGIIQSCDELSFLQSQLAMLYGQDVFLAVGRPADDSSVRQYVADLDAINEIADEMLQRPS